MNNIIDLIEKVVKSAFIEAGYSEEYAIVTRSNREDLCEFQCNAAMRLAKQLKKSPIEIAENIVSFLKLKKELIDVVAMKPGFINFNLAPSFLIEYVNTLYNDDFKENIENNKTILFDYGGPNVAKALHIGHLRSAVIGESLKRLARRLGHKVIGDVHLGDWGLQMGLIIIELRLEKPTLCYFKEDFNSEKYKNEILTPPFTIEELGEIYPRAAAKIKKESDIYDESFYKEALEATKLLQEGFEPYRCIFKHIIDVSVTDLKENYRRLNVDFDLWLGESDVQYLIPDMVKSLKDKKIAKIDNNALVVDVKRDDDKKEIPPCIIQKSDGSSLYATTDLATLVLRNKEFDLDRVVYVVDKRQELHFNQVFRVARLANIVPDECQLSFIGFGTVCGADGRPLKSRDGGTMKLKTLIDDTRDIMYNKLKENKSFDDSQAEEIAEKIAIAAIKYGDLSNQPTKDYIYNAEKFTSYEGNTGPYILYTIVRLKSILSKYKEETKEKLDFSLISDISNEEKKLMLLLSKYSVCLKDSFKDYTLHRLCSYVYEVCEGFNRLYHEVNILKEKNEDRKKSLISLLLVTEKVLMDAMDILAIKVPERM